MSEAKAVVRRYFDVILGRAPDVPLPELFTDDVVWHVPKSNPMIKPNPKRGRAGVMEVLTEGVGIYQPDTFSIQDLHLIAEGDEVVALFTLSAKLANGRDYRNDYVFYFRVRNGQICEVRENLDTMHQMNLGVFEGFV